MLLIKRLVEEAPGKAADFLFNSFFPWVAQGGTGCNRLNLATRLNPQRKLEAPQQHGNLRPR